MASWGEGVGVEVDWNNNSSSKLKIVKNVIRKGITLETSIHLFIVTLDSFYFLSKLKLCVKVAGKIFHFSLFYKIYIFSECNVRVESSSTLH